MLEWNEHGDLEKMEKFCRGRKLKEGIAWQLLGVDYFSGAGSRELAACMDGTYRRILIDYGTWCDFASMECTRCDRKVIVGSLSEWQAEYFLEVIRGNGGRDKSWSYGAVFGSEEARRSVEKEFRTAVLRIPFSADAFAITGTDMDFFQKWNVLA